MIIINKDDVEDPLLDNNNNSSINNDKVIEINQSNKIPLLKHKHLKELILIYFLYSLTVMASYLYGLFLPSLFIDYVTNNYPNLSLQDQQSKASYYKSYADSIPYISMFLIGPLLGVTSDKYGRKKIIIIGIVFASFDVISCYITSISNNLIPFFIFHSIAGLADSYVGAIFSYIADISIDQHIPILFSIASISQGVGVILGPLILMILSKFLNKYLPLFISIGVYIFCLIVLMILKESLEIAKNDNKIINNHSSNIRTNFNPFKSLYNLFKNSKNNNLLICLILLYCSIAYSSRDLMGTYYYYTTLEYNWGEKGHSYFISGVGLMIIIWGSLFIPFLSKFISTRKLISLGFFISIIAHLFFILSGFSKYLFIFGGVLIGYVPNNANLIQGLISITTPSELQGSIITGVQSLGAIVAFGSGFIVNDLYMYSVSSHSKFYFPQAPYLVNGCIVFISFCFSIIIWKIFKKK